MRFYHREHMNSVPDLETANWNTNHQQAIFMRRYLTDQTFHLGRGGDVYPLTKGVLIGVIPHLFTKGI
jgi:hypothetical protein